jgi:hypothetical protein
LGPAGSLVLARLEEAPGPEDFSFTASGSTDLADQHPYGAIVGLKQASLAIGGVAIMTVVAPIAPYGRGAIGGISLVIDNPPITFLA